jgi:hypothetical protein
MSWISHSTLASQSMLGWAGGREREEHGELGRHTLPSAQWSAGTGAEQWAWGRTGQWGRFAALRCCRLAPLPPRQQRPPRQPQREDQLRLRYALAGFGEVRWACHTSLTSWLGEVGREVVCQYPVGVLLEILVEGTQTVVAVGGSVRMAQQNPLASLGYPQ